MARLLHLRLLRSGEHGVGAAFASAALLCTGMAVFDTEDPPELVAVAFLVWILLFFSALLRAVQGGASDEASAGYAKCWGLGGVCVTVESHQRSSGPPAARLAGGRMADAFHRRGKARGQFGTLVLGRRCRTPATDLRSL